MTDSLQQAKMIDPEVLKRREQSRLDQLTRPIAGIESRTAQEVFDIMCDRIRRPADYFAKRHVHKPTDFMGEECECGRNWRDDIHLRVGETA